MNRRNHGPARRIWLALLLAACLLLVAAIAPALAETASEVAEASAEAPVDVGENDAAEAEVQEDADAVGDAAEPGDSEQDSDEVAVVDGQDATTDAAEPAGDTSDAGETSADNPGDTAGTGVAKQGLEVFFLDLGRVDGILIRCDGETSFIDVGFQADAKPAIAYLRELGVERLDSYIASHAHADHIGGAAQVIHAFQPSRIYVNRRECLSAILSYATSAQARSVRNAECVVLRAGDSFNIGGALVRCLGPASIQKCATGNITENENSLILRLDYYDNSFLFTGDTSDNALRAANKRYPGSLDVDVLKNPHHNGAHNDDVIRMITPKATIFCTDNDNIPTRTYRSALEKQGSRVFMTGSDHCGNIRITSDGTRMDAFFGYPMSALKLNPVDTMYVSQTLQLTGRLEPANLADPVNWINWKSSDTSVAQVSGGKVVAVGVGTATITATSFNGLSDSIEVEVMEAGVILETYTLSLSVGDEARLRAKILPAGTTGITGEWISADESIVIVTQKGEVLAAHEGKTQVIARLSNGAQAVCEVTVAGFTVESVTLDQHEATMRLGDQLELHASVVPEFYHDAPLQWASSDETVLWVDGSGVVTAVGTGTAKIGVRAASGVHDVCTIHVEDAEN